MDIGRAYLDDVRSQFEKLKTQVEAAIAQVGDDQLLVTLDPESNSVAAIMTHMAGNLRSRFTDFLTSDGEKPNRNRDAEFEPAPTLTREAILAEWHQGWACLFSTLEALRPEDLLRDVYIRGERHSVIQALGRQLTHHAAHAGQIVFVAKHLAGAGWKTLSIPRRRSAG